MNTLFTKEDIDRAVFKWEDLHMKTLTIYVGKHLTNDGELVTVIAHERATGIDYFLHSEVSKCTPLYS